MRKLKNIVISVLLIAVIAVGVSAVFCAQNRSGYVQCAEANATFTPAKIPYLTVYARYIGANMTTQFRTVVALNYNNEGWQYEEGNWSFSESEALIIQRPAYNTDSYNWSHYTEIS